MRVVSVNNNCQSFKAKTEYDNYYEKSHVGKALGLGVGVGCVATNVIHAGGFKEFAQDFYKKVYTLTREENQLAPQEFKKFRKPELKRMANSEMIAYVAFLVLGCTVVGGIIDAIINAERRDKADGRFV